MICLRGVLCCLLVTLLAGCAGPGPSASTAPALRILSGSENQTLQPLVDRFASQHGVRVDVTYRGSVDIMLDLGRDDIAYDAVWPASSIWLELGDTKRRVRHEKSIMRSPVVLGVKESVARQLGWVGTPVTVADILKAAEAGRLRFVMASASQSDSGASAYVGYLYAFAGNPEVLTADHLREPAVRDQIRRILGAVNQSSGGSAQLKDLFLSQYDRLDAMVNYEALIIEANQDLARGGREPLYAVYPVDGLAIADGPLAYVGRSDPGKEELFHKLQDHLLSAAVQEEIRGRGWRVGLLELEPHKADAAVFNPAWGVAVDRLLTPIRFPRGPVIREAIQLYQTTFRKPSLTIWCLDFSGSMAGKGEQQLKEAMRTLLDQQSAGQHLLQATADDINIVIPFDDALMGEWTVQGNDPEALKALAARIDATRTRSGTNIYAPVIRALTILKQRGAGERLPAIVLMTDGRPNSGTFNQLKQHREQLGITDVPVHAILFGDASRDQLQEITRLTAGQIFDGRSNLVDAFRTVKGYN